MSRCLGVEPRQMNVVVQNSTIDVYNIIFFISMVTALDTEEVVIGSVAYKCLTKFEKCCGGSDLQGWESGAGGGKLPRA